MIHLITADNAFLYPRAVRELHAERRRHFIAERGWALQERDGGEYDRYDDELAAHLVAFDPRGRIEAGARLRPTHRGGVLADVFPHLISSSERDVRSQGTFECTRYFTTRHARGRASFLARSRLHVALIEAVRALGGDRLLGFVDLPLLTHLRRFSGLRIRPVGLPETYEEGGDAIAFEIGVSQDDLEQARLKLALSGGQLFIAPAWLPPGFDVRSLGRAVAALQTPGRPCDIVRTSIARAARVMSTPDIDLVKLRLSADAA